eukprot:gene17682-23272_t
MLSLSKYPIEGTNSVLGWGADEYAFSCNEESTKCLPHQSSKASKYLPRSSMNLMKVGWRCAQRRPLRALAHILLLVNPYFVVVADDDTLVNYNLIINNFGHILFNQSYSNSIPYVIGEFIGAWGEHGHLTLKGFYGGGSGYILSQLVLRKLISYEIAFWDTAIADSYSHRSSFQIKHLSMLDDGLANLEHCEASSKSKCIGENITSSLIPILSNNSVDNLIVPIGVRLIDYCVNLMANENTCFHSDHSFGRCLVYGINLHPMGSVCLSQVSNPPSDLLVGMCFSAPECDLNKRVTCHSRCTYWESQVGTTLTAPTSDYTIFEEYGGVVAYETSDFVPRTVDQIYSYDAAPHIVFVLVDDWGYNDVGFRSTYLSWTTPTFDNLASEGVTLENYYTNQLCSPSRASLLTGRFSLRTGILENTGELGYNETTLAEEMKSAGYMTYLVGKWHLGLSTLQHYPTNRGFDYYYGYLSGEINYWSKASQYNDYMDLTENLNLVTNETETSDKYHTAYLFADKAQAVIEKHATEYPDKPMFFYYALQLIHSYWSAPSTYQDRCEYPTTSDNDTNFELWNYCALNVMLDEVISNLTCVLKETGLSDNTILIISGDNGGNSEINGNSYPFRGHKDTFFRGGVSNTAIINSPLLPDAARGLKYYGQVHISDWLPTLMGLATDGAWTGSLNGAVLDGKDVWDAIITNSPSPKIEIVLTHYGETCAIQYDNTTYMQSLSAYGVNKPDYVFKSDQDSELSNTLCSNPKEVNSVQLDIRTGHQVTIDKVINWLNNNSNSQKTLCDAGCGVGSLALPIAPYFKKIYASDISESMTIEAENRAKSLNIKNTEFTVSDLEALSGSYDIVTCIDVMIHYPTDKMYDIVKKLGSLSKERLILSFAPKTWYYDLLKKIGELFPGKSKTTRAYLHPEEKVIEALKLAGFKIVREDMTGTKFYFSRLFEAVRE